MAQVMCSRCGNTYFTVTISADDDRATLHCMSCGTELAVKIVGVKQAYS